MTTLIAVIMVGTVNIAVNPGSSTMAFLELDLRISDSWVIRKGSSCLPSKKHDHGQVT